MMRSWLVLGFAAVLSCGGGGGPVGTIDTDAGKFTVTDVESGQIDVTVCHGTDCTIRRDGVNGVHREILVTLEPEDEITDARALQESIFASGCRSGSLFVRDESSRFGCESFNVSAEDGGGVAIVFSYTNCNACPNDGFDGDLYLVAPGNDELLLD